MVQKWLEAWRNLVTLHVSVWVEMALVVDLDFDNLVTLHVSVWVEILTEGLKKIYPASRSTWACELKCCFQDFQTNWSCHAPRERVSWNHHLDKYAFKSNGSRSTWACELKSGSPRKAACGSSHAPRERVSWNVKLNGYSEVPYVTLHVSVWVEIPKFAHTGNGPVVTLHVSVWVEINGIYGKGTEKAVTLHVSVWVEM